MSFLSRRRQRTPNESSQGMSSINDFRNEIDRLFDRFTSNLWSGAAPNEWSMTEWNPSLDLMESDSEITLRVELPGIEPEKINVSVSDGRLIIAGEKTESVEEKEPDYYHCERRFGSFRRLVRIPDGVDAKDVDAEFNNGVLTITVPKPEQAKLHQVEVKMTPSTRRGKPVAVAAR